MENDMKVLGILYAFICVFLRTVASLRFHFSDALSENCSEARKKIIKIILQYSRIGDTHTIFVKGTKHKVRIEHSYLLLPDPPYRNSGLCPIEAIFTTSKNITL